MIYLNIMSKSSAKRTSYKIDCRTAIISIRNVEDKIVYFHRNEHLKGVLLLAFDDVSAEEAFCMKAEDGESIKDFLRAVLPNIDRLIIHCEAGISRSAGVAAAIMKALTNSDKSIFNDSNYIPNMHCYRITLNAVFDENGNSLIGNEEVIIER